LRLQVDLDDCYTVERIGFDVFNVIDRCGQGPLETVVMRRSISWAGMPV
jgi:hypothetical protein